jgi:hypothetical protein
MSIYHNTYHNLCQRGKALKESYKPGSELHKHHITPKHAGGSDHESNLTYLTVKEHILAHFMLWKMHKNINDLRAMNMLGANLNVEYRRKIGKWCHENNIGFHGATKEDRIEWSKRGIETQKRSNSEDTFYYWSTEQGRKKRASMGGSKTWENKSNKEWLYWMSPEGRKKRASMGGKAHKGKKCMHRPGDKTFKRVNPEDVEYMLSEGYIFGSPNKTNNGGGRRRRG